jgi:benzodiazapine receptor
MTRNSSDWAGNIGAFVLVIAVNGLANALPIGGQTTGEVSAKYPSLFTPAGFTFSIWGVIYTGLLLFLIYQSLPAQRQSESLAKIGTLFKLNCVFNAVWIFAWHYDLLIVSLLLMGGILATLVLIYRSLGAGLGHASLLEKLCVHAPFSLYVGWITVATIANISAVQINAGLDDAGLSAIDWTLLKLAIAGAIGATVIAIRGDVLYISVVAWAAFGIVSKQAATPEVAGAAATLSMLAIFIGVISLVRKRSLLPAV